MTCKDCIHSGLCYKENDHDNFPDRCGDFISDKVLEERAKGEWRTRKQGDCPITDTCTNCQYEMKWYKNKYKYCPECGAKMEVNNE